MRFKVGDTVRIKLHVGDSEYSLQDDMKALAGKIGTIQQIVNNHNYEYYLDIFPNGFWFEHELEICCVNKGKFTNVKE